MFYNEFERQRAEPAESEDEQQKRQLEEGYRLYTYSQPYQEDSYSPQPPTPACSQGHRSSLILQTLEGGSICLTCFSNLISNSKSPTIHVSYALSQLSRALSHAPFLQILRTLHTHLLVSPLVSALSYFDDEPIARQTISIVLDLCNSCDPPVCGEFVARIADRLSSGALEWSRRQVYSLHCLGLLLSSEMHNSFAHIKDIHALFSNLMEGLQLPSEEIQGEILFVLYKLSILYYDTKDGNGTDILHALCPKLLYLALEALIKTQRDDVRLNCVAFLLVLAQRGFFGHVFANDVSSLSSDENFMHLTGHDGPSLNILFTEAVKGSLLSSDDQVQIGTLDLVFHYLSSEGSPSKQIQVLVEEHIGDYILEVLRLSGTECKDPIVNSCLQVLDLLSKSEQAFRQKLPIGFSTLVKVLHHVAKVPFHPAQTQTLNLLLHCLSDFPGIISTSHIVEIGNLLTELLKKHADSGTAMLTETFNMACSVFVALLKSPCSHDNSNLVISIQEASKHAIIASLRSCRTDPSQLLHALSVLTEAYAYSQENSSFNLELSISVVGICKTHILPWIITSLDETDDEEIVLGVLETFHSILLRDSDIQAEEFAEVLVSSHWFNLSFGCLGLFPTKKMKLRVYLMLSSIVDVIFGIDSGQSIRDAAIFLPSDPTDLLFLLGQKSSHNPELVSCQSAILLILYAASLHDDRLADEKLVFASLEQYILVNGNNFLIGAADSKTMTQLLNLYALSRAFANTNYQIPYSPEAENILLKIMVEKEWDLLSGRIHSTSLKWLFQQEKIRNFLSYQILKLCRTNNSNGTNMIIHEKDYQYMDVRAIAELVASGDNFGAEILVCLMRQLAQEEGQEQDMILVLNLTADIINIFPAAADHLCYHGISNGMNNLYCHSRMSSPDLFVAMALLTLTILRFVQPETILDEEYWLPISVKLMDYLTSTVTVDTWTHESLLVIGILSLMLHHSVNQRLTEASKFLLLSTSLVPTFKNFIYAACSKGPALIDHDKETSTGETLVFVLLLQYFSLKSLHVVLPGAINWQTFLEPSEELQPLSIFCIHFNDLCRLLHFGPPTVKLISSYCLLELLTRISVQINENITDISCMKRYLVSVLAVLEGLIFYTDVRVAINCSLCLSIISGWNKFRESHWGRLIVEELAMSLAVPCLASKSFMIHHKPAVHVAVTLLQLPEVPQWMRLIFDESCIYAIIENLSASNLSAEIVLLFRELLNFDYLNVDQIATLSRVLQACRKDLYNDSTIEDSTDQYLEKVVCIPNDLGKVREFLLHLISYDSSVNTHDTGLSSEKKRLLAEIEMFFMNLTDKVDD